MSEGTVQASLMVPTGTFGTFAAMSSTQLTLHLPFNHPLRYQTVQPSLQRMLSSCLAEDTPSAHRLGRSTWIIYSAQPCATTAVPFGAWTATL